MNTQATGVQLTAILGPGLMGLYQLARFLQRRERARGMHAGLCLMLCLNEGLRLRDWGPEWNTVLHPLALTVTVPLIMHHVESLFPRPWLRSLTTYTWGYVLPYGIILGVYPASQLRPIIPIMWTFSGLSLAGTLLALLQSCRDRQRGSLLLLLTLGLWLAGLVHEPLTAPSALLLTVLGAWLISRLSDKAGWTRP